MNLVWELELFVERDKLLKGTPVTKASYVAPESPLLVTDFLASSSSELSPSTPSTAATPSTQAGLPLINGYVDPLQDYNASEVCAGQSLPCGQIINYLWTSELDCWT